MLRFFALVGVLAIAAVGASSALANGAGGVTGAAFYVDGDLYRTVNTPTDLSGTGAPAKSFDTIYSFEGLQPNVATAAPGDPGYNGGRWRVEVLGFPMGYAAAVAVADAIANGGNGSGDIDSDEELQTAFDAGLAVDAGDGPSFVCPVIKLT